MSFVCFIFSLIQHRKNHIITILFQVKIKCLQRNKMVETSNAAQTNTWLLTVKTQKNETDFFNAIYTLACHESEAR